MVSGMDPVPNAYRNPEISTSDWVLTSMAAYPPILPFPVAMVDQFFVVCALTPLCVHFKTCWLDTKGTSD